MIRPEKSKSVAMSRAPTPKSPVIQPMPKTSSAGRVLPNPITAFTNEANAKMPRMGNMSVNPGKAGGK